MNKRISFMMKDSHLSKQFGIVEILNFFDALDNSGLKYDFGICISIRSKVIYNGIESFRYSCLFFFPFQRQRFRICVCNDKVQNFDIFFQPVISYVHGEK